MDEPQRPLWREWLDQAERDLSLAREIQASYPESSVFSAQQAAEKAAKALWIAERPETPPRTHAVDRLLGDLGAPVELVEAGSALAEAYVTSRYPDVAAMAPFRALRERDSAQAVSQAEEIVGWIKRQLEDK